MWGRHIQKFCFSGIKSGSKVFTASSRPFSTGIKSQSALSTSSYAVASTTPSSHFWIWDFGKDYARTICSYSTAVSFFASLFTFVSGEDWFFCGETDFVFLKVGSLLLIVPRLAFLPFKALCLANFSAFLFRYSLNYLKILVPASSSILALISAK